jgi:hypothetical protein
MSQPDPVRPSRNSAVTSKVIPTWENGVRRIRTSDDCAHQLVLDRLEGSGPPLMCPTWDSGGLEQVRPTGLKLVGKAKALSHVGKTAPSRPPCLAPGLILRPVPRLGLASEIVPRMLTGGLGTGSHAWRDTAVSAGTVSLTHLGGRRPQIFPRGKLAPPHAVLPHHRRLLQADYKEVVQTTSGTWSAARVIRRNRTQQGGRFRPCTVCRISHVGFRRTRAGAAERP